MTGQDRIIVSRPTFAELGDALTRAGLGDLFNEDGEIELAQMTICTDSHVRQNIRAAVGIDQHATAPRVGDPIYQDEAVTFHVTSRGDGVHLVEQRHGMDPTIMVLPKDALTPVAGELVECLVKRAC